jgi:hypothetical protein
MNPRQQRQHSLTCILVRRVGSMRAIKKKLSTAPGMQVRAGESFEKVPRRQHKHHRAWNHLLASCLMQCDVSCLVCLWLCLACLGGLACASWRIP